MSDYRVGLTIEDVTDDIGNQFTVIVDRYGYRYTVVSFDMTKQDDPWMYRDTFQHFVRPSGRWNLSLGLREMPLPPPPKPRRTWAKSMGLRRPK